MPTHRLSVKSFIKYRPPQAGMHNGENDSEELSFLCCLSDPCSTQLILDFIRRQKIFPNIISLLKKENYAIFKTQKGTTAKSGLTFKLSREKPPFNSGSKFLGWFFYAILYQRHIKKMNVSNANTNNSYPRIDYRQDNFISRSPVPR